MQRKYQVAIAIIVLVVRLMSKIPFLSSYFNMMVQRGSLTGKDLAVICTLSALIYACVFIT